MCLITTRVFSLPPPPERLVSSHGMPFCRRRRTFIFYYYFSPSRPHFFFSLHTCIYINIYTRYFYTQTHIHPVFVPSKYFLYIRKDAFGKSSNNSDSHTHVNTSQAMTSRLYVYTYVHCGFRRITIQVLKPINTKKYIFLKGQYLIVTNKVLCNYITQMIFFSFCYTQLCVAATCFRRDCCSPPTDVFVVRKSSNLLSTNSLDLNGE